MSDIPRLSEALAQSSIAGLAPGLGGVLLAGEKNSRIAALGRRSAFARERVTVSDYWHIGSCTKAMTATLVAQLVDRGLIGFETSLSDALPAIAPKMHPTFQRTTLADLLMHEAGVIRDPQRSTFSALRRSDASVSAQRIFLATEALKIRAYPGAGYSNVGYIVAGAVVEHVLGMPWEQAIAQEVMAPLGIARFGFGPPGEIGTLDQPRGHRLIHGAWRVESAAEKGDNPLAYGPAGRVHITLSDWGRFLSVHLGRGPRGFLSSATLKRLHTAGPNEFAMGWRAGRDAHTGEARLFHTGSNTAWFAKAVLAPLRGTGIGIVCNGFSDEVTKAMNTLATELMRYDDPVDAP